MAGISEIIMTTGKKTVAEILKMGSQSVVNERTFTVLARVDCIYQPSGWCYVTCYRCSKKIQAIGGLFVCNICDTICRYLMIRYSTQLCASDSSGNIIFTIHNRVGEKLLDSTANKFYNRLPPDQFPEPLIDLVGRCFAFKIRLPDLNNPDHDFHTYRVVGISEVAPPPGLNGCVSAEELIGVPNKAVESACSASKGVVPLGVPTPEKEYTSKRMRTG